ncbi:MAG: hypothetical protein EOQ57_27005 [Mesorhizobium sp.]|nr:MAG: hypothetical protein EOQ57_27005 [Mesorhizobium sp.]
MLLAAFLAVGFSSSAAQASVAPLMTKVESGMAMAKMSNTAMIGDCSACLKGAGDSRGQVKCLPTCIAPVLGVLPQAIAVTLVPRMEQPLALLTPFLRGRSLLPDPIPPRPSA